MRSLFETTVYVIAYSLYQLDDVFSTGENFLEILCSIIIDVRFEHHRPAEDNRHIVADIDNVRYCEAGGTLTLCDEFHFKPFWSADASSSAFVSGMGKVSD